MIEILNAHLEHFYPLYWSILFIIETGGCIVGVWYAKKEVKLALEEIEWARKEYEYDEAKDLAKKQRRTRTTKKTTTQPSGISTTEETTEVTEPFPSGSTNDTSGEQK